MSDLAGFLLARLAEKEAGAWEIHNWHDCDDRHPCVCGVPDHIKAECEAKRQIVRMLDNVLQSFSAQNGGPGRLMWTNVNRRERHHANETLYRLALSYADHPDYREEWKP